MIAFSGVRSSWLMLARKALLARLASIASSRAVSSFSFRSRSRRSERTFSVTSLATPITPCMRPRLSLNGAVQVSKLRSRNSKAPRSAAPVSARRTPSSSGGMPANTSKADLLGPRDSLLCGSHMCASSPTAASPRPSSKMICPRVSTANSTSGTFATTLRSTSRCTALRCTSASAGATRPATYTTCSASLRRRSTAAARRSPAAAPPRSAARPARAATTPRATPRGPPGRS
jgi:hypothetical protein